MREENVMGYDLTFDEAGAIVSIGRISYTITVGDTVLSNGRGFVEKGRTGEVKEILEPGKNGLTSDVVRVQFRGDLVPKNMKLEEVAKITDERLLGLLRNL